MDRGAGFADRLCLKVDLDAVELDLIALSVAGQDRIAFFISFRADLADRFGWFWINLS